MEQTQLAEPDAPAAPATDTARRGAWSRWRPLLMRMHFYAGVLVAPFLLVAAVTGLLYAVTPQLDNVIYQDELKVASSPTAQTRLPLSQQIANARTHYPDGAITSIRLPAAADDTTRIVLAAPDVPKDYARTVFVDPYTGKVKGALTTYGQWLPIRAWFDELHRTLHLGDVGRNYSELAASWLAVIALGGLALWIGHRRRTAAMRRIALPDRGIQGRSRTRSWHGAVGVWVVLGLLFLSATGLTWSRYAGDNIGQLRSELQWSTPSVSTSLTGAAESSSGGGHGHHGGGSTPKPIGDTQLATQADTVANAANRAGLRGPVWLAPATGPDQAWQVEEKKRSAPTRFDSIAVNPNDGSVTDRTTFDSWPLMAKLTNWTIDAHMGVLFGIPNQIALVLLMIGLISVIVRGYLMWWRRRPTRDTGESRMPMGRAPRQGALLELRPAEAVALVAVIGVIGWYVPLLGLPLLLFVGFDTARGMWLARREVAR